MNEAEKCPVCRSGGRKERGREDGEYVAYYVCDTCMFMCGLEDLHRVAAAMELAKATRTLEDAMAPLNSGKLKMGEALPAIRLAMTDQKACEQRVLEMFK